MSWERIFEEHKGDRRVEKAFSLFDGRRINRRNAPGKRYTKKMYAEEANTGAGWQCILPVVLYLSYVRYEVVRGR